MSLLFLADEQKNMIDRYLDDGDMLVLYAPIRWANARCATVT